VFRRFWFVSLCVVVTALAVVVLAMVNVRFRSSASRLPVRGLVEEEAATCPGPVEVRFDDRGIAHIRADTERALWFAAGYVHARDRFFQMDMVRRMASGRLAETLGPRALSIDRKMRVWRVAASARRQASLLSVGERWTLEAYTAGVNAAVDRHGRWIAPEIWMTGLPTEPWQVEDSLSIGLLLQLSMTPAMGLELDRAVQLARFGADRATDLWGWTPEETDRWIPPSPPISTPRQEDEAILPGFTAVGSNAWAVAPSRSATGRPLLANDAHLGVAFPGPYYALHLHSPELHVAGVSVPGVPGILIGHNEDVAWGLTNSLVDDQDLYVLTLDQQRDRELIDEDWRDLRTVTERIAVRWMDEPEVIKIRLSERGPLVRERGPEVLALEWSGLRGTSSLGSILNTNRARSVQDVVAAWRDEQGPYHHIVAADRDGQIVQFIGGTVPGRARGAGRLPSPGQQSAWSWKKDLGTSRSLIRLDPEDGIAAVANHDPFMEGDYRSATPVPGEFAPPWRVRRLRRVLAARDDWSTGGFQGLQADVVSGQAVALMRQLRPDLEAHGGRTSALLAAWDGRLDAESVAAHAYTRLLVELAGEIGGDEAATDGLPSTPVGPTEILRLLAGGLDERWWDDVRTVVTEDRSAIVDRVLTRLDAHKNLPAWGRVHQVSFDHPFRRVPLVAAWLGRTWSRGPFAVGGDDTTINAHPWSSRDPFSVVAIPSVRMVADVGNWDDTLIGLSAGQSGRPWSPHYSDQMGDWLEVRLRPFPFTADAVDAATVARLVIRPPTGD
jgi:penicillin amidase